MTQLADARSAPQLKRSAKIMLQDNSNREYDGMTLNERLFVAGLVGELDKAVKEKKRNEMKEILMRVQLTEQEAEWSVEQILSEPQKYGF